MMIKYGFSVFAVATMFVAFAGTVSPVAAQSGGEDAPALSLAQARQMVDAAEAEARANEWNVTIVVTDVDGVPIYLRRLDGASPRSYDIAFNKARTVAATGMSTLEYGQALNAGTVQPIENGINFEGGLPIRLGGELVGGIGTSGVRSNEDAQISRAGLAAIGAN
jgi:glc operon protein GlcG